jgi:rhodanese-related sulfurtransferase
MQSMIQKGIINSQELQNLLVKRDAGEQSFVLVDVREEGEYNMSHIKGADMLKPLSTMAEWAEALAEETKDKIVIFTCHTGARSGDMQNVFKKKGHTQTLNHIGGIMSFRGEVVR